MAIGNGDLAISYRAKFDNALALEYATKELNIYQQLGNKGGMASALANMAYACLGLGAYAKALDYSFSALKIYEEINDKKYQPIVLENIGTIYKEMAEYEKAMQYYTAAYNINKEAGDRAAIARNLGNMGTILNATGHYDSAIAYVSKAFKINQEAGDIFAVHTNLGNIANIYFSRHDFKNAMKYHKMALNTTEGAEYKNNKAIDLGNVGETYFEIAKAAPTRALKSENLASAITYLNDAIAKCREIYYPMPQLEFMKYLKDAYMASGDYQKALATYEDYARLKDSVFSLQSKSTIAQLESNRELSIKTKDLEIKNNQLRIIELELAKKRNERLIYIVSIVLFGMVLGGVIKRLSTFITSNRKLRMKNKQAEDELVHNESRMRQAQAIAHIGNWEINFETGRGVWSEETCNIYGVAPEDNIQTHDQWLAFIHPDDLDYVKKITRESQETSSSSAFFHRIIRKDGEVRYVYSQSEIEFRDGIAVGLYGVVHDITNMKQAEDALQLSMTNLNAILDLIPQSVFVKNYSGKFIFVNKSFSALYGLVPEQLLNKTQADTIPDNNDPDFFIRQDQEIIEAGITRTIPEMHFIDYAGNRRTFRTIKFPYKVPGTNEQAVLGISEDITELRKTEEERIKMISDIVHRNKDLEQFSYIVSHNLRAPVANIIGLTNLFQIATFDTDETKIMMQDLSITVAKLDNIIKDLNYILQIRNQVSENRTEVRFSELLADIEDSLSVLLKDSKATMISDFSEADELFSIKTYLYSIFFNLISNSIKYRRAGIPPVIEIVSRKSGNATEIVFKDNGLGIDLKQYGTYIFGLYKRFHHHVEGKGVGLYMVKAQVETLGGRISVESELNAGTTFKIVFENSNIQTSDRSETDE